VLLGASFIHRPGRRLLNIVTKDKNLFLPDVAMQPSQCYGCHRAKAGSCLIGLMYELKEVSAKRITLISKLLLNLKQKPHEQK